jgi:7-cyano-7-deazaguanine synthase
MPKSALIVLSGGMDSSVLAFKLAAEGYSLKAISFNYGQKHRLKEISCAAKQAANLGIEHRIVDLTSITKLFGSSALTDADSAIPDGHYTADSMKVTVVPNRNMIMLSIAAAWAISLKYHFLAYAAHAGDHSIYPDCRPEFTEAIDAALQLADWHKVALLSPFVSLSKADICKIGQTLGINYSETWSCYRGGDKHCGSCGTCVERKEAFEIAGVVDPTQYES